VSELFIDIEALLIPWLETKLGVRVVSELPPEAAPPIIRLYRISGADNDYKLDRPIIDIDVFAASRPEAAALSERVRTAIRDDLRGLVLSGVVISYPFTIIGPRWLPDTNTDWRRYSASYEVLLHKAPQHA
jgi:hypothetical protein